MEETLPRLTARGSSVAYIKLLGSNRTTTDSVDIEGGRLGGACVFGGGVGGRGVCEYVVCMCLCNGVCLFVCCVYVSAWMASCSDRSTCLIGRRCLLLASMFWHICRTCDIHSYWSHSEPPKKSCLYSSGTDRDLWSWGRLGAADKAAVLPQPRGRGRPVATPRVPSYPNSCRCGR